ncbi:MAG TPA: hypothetical protein EYP98_20615, partial [Planctomycetes bacterium]|nr:hypothetical protein [Planctomycetota bacterium]
MGLRVYTDGVWDVLHVGHVALFRTIKTDMFTGDDVFLIVGCAGDEACARKGETVMSTAERVSMVRQCRYVDAVVSDCPWRIDADFMSRHAIDYVVHDGEPYPGDDTPDIYAFVKQSGRFVASTRTPGVSTSDIITRILADYNRFLLRNLKRGTSHEELNISDFKARYLLLKDTMTQKNKLFRAAALQLVDSIPPPPSRWLLKAYVLASAAVISAAVIYSARSGGAPRWLQQQEALQPPVRPAQNNQQHEAEQLPHVAGAFCVHREGNDAPNQRRHVAHPAQPAAGSARERLWAGGHVRPVLRLRVHQQPHERLHRLRHHAQRARFAARGGDTDATNERRVRVLALHREQRRGRRVRLPTNDALLLLLHPLHARP